MLSFGTETSGKRRVSRVATVTSSHCGGVDWRVLLALFACDGATPEAAALLQAQGGLVVDLAALYADLALEG